MAAQKTTRRVSKPGPAARRKSRNTKKERPVRREVWGCIALVLALCVLVNRSQRDAILVGWLSVLFGGLVGCGFPVLAPAFGLAAFTLFTHRGRPVHWQLLCAMLLPVIAGALGHLMSADPASAMDLGLSAYTVRLWTTGQAGVSGGVLSGFLAEGCKAFLSRPVSLILLSVSLVALVMGATRLTPDVIADGARDMLYRLRNLPRYEEPPIPRKRERPAGEFTFPERRAPRTTDFPMEWDEPPKRLNPPKWKPVWKSPFPSMARAAGDAADRVRGFVSGVFRREAPAPEPERPAVKTPPKPKAPKKPNVPAAPPEVIPLPAPPPEEPPAEPAAEPVRKKRKSARQEVDAQRAAVTEEIACRPPGPEAYRKPDLSLLKRGGGRNRTDMGPQLQANAQHLERTLESFDVKAVSCGEPVCGPSVTRYEFRLKKGVKLSKITNLSDDIALALGSTGVRIAPIPSKSSVVGIEVPNRQVVPVLVGDVIESKEFQNHRSPTAFALGKDIAGRNIVGCIEQLPHVLIAGTTGSGKSVCMNSLIVSLLYKSTPEEIRFIMVDPKMVELAPYNGIPHLLIPVVTDPKKAAGALQWAVSEMLKRYQTFSENGVKNLESFNRIAPVRDGLSRMPSVIVVIDELADLMLAAAKEVEESIMRVAQMGRAAGIHLVIATQRPSADIITGLMKANIPSRIAFAVASAMESRIILDMAGAEKLVGRGDMLYAPLGESRIRVQGCYISPGEIEKVVEAVKQAGEARYDADVISTIEASVQEKPEKAVKKPDPSEETDELLPAAVEIALEIGQMSTSMLQRRLKLGYSRAARLVDQMEQRGYVGPPDGSRPRQILITREEWQRHTTKQ